MIVVMGYVTVSPADRDAHLELSAPSVAVARSSPGCLHFAVSADALDQERVNVAELWLSREDLNRFRELPGGVDAEDPFVFIREFHVREIDVMG